MRALGANRVLHGSRLKDGIFYFLGNVPSHINHALPLYRRVGGTFVVLSQDAYDYCKSFGVDVVMLDDDRELFLQFDTRLIQNTINYLNENARVVIYYEIYPIAPLIEAKQVMLTHGNSFKDYYIDWRRDYLAFYDYFAGLGPIWEANTIKAGVNPDKILKVGLARQDSIISNRTNAKKARKIQDSVQRRGKKIITYMPTWWGPTSVNDLGKRIVRYASEDYILIFRPHPSTPDELIAEYLDIINTEKLNIFYVPEGNDYDLSLEDILCGSDLFIGDMSSVVLEALLAKKPIIIAYGAGDRSQDESLYEPIFPVIKSFTPLVYNNAHQLNNLVDNTLNTPISRASYDESIGRVFYGSDGGNVNYLAEIIKGLLDGALDNR